MKANAWKQPYIYFDNAATAPLAPVARDILQSCLAEDWAFANPSSLHDAGRNAKGKLDEARETIAACIHAEPEEVIFTGSGSEGNNLVVRGIADATPTDTLRVLISPFEHPAVSQPVNHLQAAGHCQVHKLKAGEDGVVEVPKAQATPGYGLVSVMMVNNELGSRQPVEAITKYFQGSKTPIHTDAVQAVGHIPVNVKKLGVDYLTASGHKFNGPHGTGFAYVRKGAPILPVPLILGGGQELGWRSSTENVLGAYCMAKTLAWHCLHMKRNRAYIQGLKAYCIGQLQKAQGTGVVFNGDPLAAGNYGIGTIHYSLPNIKMDGQTLLLMLAAALPGWELPVYTSTGSACSSGIVAASPTLMALPGMDFGRASKSIRISFGLDNTASEIDYFIRKQKFILERVQ